MDPCGTPHNSFPGSENILFKFTLNFLFDKYDLNNNVTLLEKPKQSILLISKSWLIVSNAFWRSISIKPVWRPDSKPVHQVQWHFGPSGHVISGDIQKSLYLDFHGTYQHQTWSDDALWWVLFIYHV